MLLEVDGLVAMHGLAPLNLALSSRSTSGCIPLSSSSRMFNTSSWKFSVLCWLQGMVHALLDIGLSCRLMLEGSSYMSWHIHGAQRELHTWFHPLGRLTVKPEQSYISQFEDEFGNVQEKELPCPEQAHMLYGFLPLIDEHNKACQNSLALEKCWMTKSCWNWIITTLLGLAVVDVQCWDCNKRRGHMMRSFAAVGDVDDDGVVDDFDIKTMANLIG